MTRSLNQWAVLTGRVMTKYPTTNNLEDGPITTQNQNPHISSTPLIESDAKTPAAGQILSGATRKIMMAAASVCGIGDSPEASGWMCQYIGGSGPDLDRGTSVSSVSTDV